MHPKIKEQQRLMKQALKLLEDRETIETLITPVDPVISKVMVNDLKNQYLTVMKTLLLNLAEVAGGVPAEIDNHGL